MSKREQIDNLVKLLSELQHKPAPENTAADQNTLSPQMALLRAWQSQRLERTYADLLTDERYRPACEFFLSDIYAPRDFSQRDQDAEQLYALLAPRLPAPALALLADAIRVNHLTQSLDQKLLHVLVKDLGFSDRLDEQTYAQAYRLCDNYAERQVQIELLGDILRKVGKAARNPLVGVASRLARVPAQRAGWAEMYDFLARGYGALRKMRKTDRFIAIIQTRETQILARIYAGDTRPFRL